MGIGNHLSLQAGGFWMGQSLSNTPFIGTGKYTFYQKDYTAAAGGVMFVKWPKVTKGAIGILFVTGSMGNALHHGSLSLGWGFAQANGETVTMHSPIITGALNYRLSPKFAAVTETWLFPTDTSFFMTLVALRFLGKRISVDLGSILSGNGNGDFASSHPPLINFSYHF